MLVQITKSSHDKVWYKKKIFQIFEVRDDNSRKNVYLLSPNQLKLLGKKETSVVAISKMDCVVING